MNNERDLFDNNNKTNKKQKTKRDLAHYKMSFFKPFSWFGEKIWEEVLFWVSGKT